MAEVHNSWQDTMGEPYQIPDNPVYDASNILRPTTMTPAHADMFNEIFSRLIVNTAAVKSIADSKAGTDTAASDQDGLMSKEDKTALDQAVLNIAALSGILGDGTAGGDLQGSYPNPAINPAKLVNIKPTFAQAESRAKIANGDTLAIILGKIAKMYVDLKAVAWSGSYADLTNKPSSFTPAAHTHDDRYFTEAEINISLAEKADVNQNWIELPINAGFNYSGTRPKYCKDTLGFVHLIGYMTSESNTIISPDVPFATLPAGFYPSGTVYLPIVVLYDTNHGDGAALQIKNGVISLYQPHYIKDFAGGGVSLWGVSFWVG